MVVGVRFDRDMGKGTRCRNGGGGRGGVEVEEEEEEEEEEAKARGSRSVARGIKPNLAAVPPISMPRT